MEQKKRITYLEVLRIIAILGVLVNHVPLAAVHLYDGVATNIDRYIVNGIVHVVHFAVPLFVMITGALLLQPSRPISYRKVLTKYVWRMVIILATIGTIYAWMEIYFEEKHFEFRQFFVALLNTIEGNTWRHMWYLYMLIGIYLIIPVLKATINVLTKKQLDILIGILFLFTCIFPVIGFYLDIQIGIQFPIMSHYVFYLLIGYRLTKMSIMNIRWLVCSIIFLALAYLLFAYLEYVKGYLSLTKLSAYNSPIMAIYSVFIFIMVKGLKYDFRKFLNEYGGSKFARDSFGIYVFHMLWVNIIYKVLKVNPIELGLWTCIPILIGIIILSWGTTILFRRVPYIGKYI